MSNFSAIKRPVKYICILLLLLGFMSAPLSAQYSVKTGSEPTVMAILYHKDNPKALIYYNQQRFNASEKMHLDQEWYVDKIRRETVLFKRTSTRTFVEMALEPAKKSQFHRDWSFLGRPISLWEAVELLAHGFGYQAIMHYQAGGAVIPGCHGDSISSVLKKVMPPHHRFAIAGPVLLVLPVRPADEDWAKVLRRMNIDSAARLALRFPGLNKSGILFSRGDDIQFVLKKIALGGKTPIQFPRDLHFPVYCSFRNMPFFQILKKIVYLNQCIIIERENGLEITPWPRQILRNKPVPDYPRIIVNPIEPQPGTGPNPPPLREEHLRNYPLIHQNLND